MPTRRPNNTDRVLKSLLKIGESSIAEIAEDTGLTRHQVNSTLYISLGRYIKRTMIYKPFTYYLTPIGKERANEPM